MNFSWRKGHRRGPNDVIADTDKRVSDDGLRSAIGRNYKVKLPKTWNGPDYDIVRAFTLKERRNNKWETVRIQMSEEAANQWLKEGVL